jgi:hypothetical protein
VPSTPAIGLEFGKDAIPEKDSILLDMEIFRMIEFSIATLQSLLTGMCLCME